MIQSLPKEGVGGGKYGPNGQNLDGLNEIFVDGPNDIFWMDQNKKIGSSGRKI